MSLRLILEAEIFNKKNSNSKDIEIGEEIEIEKREINLKTKSNGGGKTKKMMEKRGEVMKQSAVIEYSQTRVKIRS